MTEGVLERLDPPATDEVLASWYDVASDLVDSEPALLLEESEAA